MATAVLLISMLGALLIGAMSPGPSFVLVSRTALANSRRAGLAAAAGMGIGGFVFALLGLAGLIALLEAVDWLFLALKIVGGLYLIYLGIKIWRHADQQLDQTGASGAAAGSLHRAFWLGFLTQVSNPKTAVVYTSIFAVFLPQDPSLTLLVIIPPAIMAVEFGWYAVVALLFSAHRPRQHYLNSKRVIDRLAGAVMGVLGTRLVVDGLR